MPAALLKAMQECGRGVDIAAMERSTYREESSLPDADWAAAAQSGGFQAVLVNPDWACKGRGDAVVKVRCVPTAARGLC
jgi:hypothetical protein